MNLPLRFRKWDGDEWPEKRVSIADYEGHAIFISARYVPIEVAETFADKVVRAVNSHDALVEALEEAMSWNWLEDTPPPKEIIERLEQTLVVAKGEDNV